MRREHHDTRDGATNKTKGHKEEKLQQAFRINFKSPLVRYIWEDFWHEVHEQLKYELTAM